MSAESSRVARLAVNSLAVGPQTGAKSRCILFDCVRRQEPSPAKDARKTRLGHKVTKLREEMQRLKVLEKQMLVTSRPGLSLGSILEFDQALLD